MRIMVLEAMCGFIIKTQDRVLKISVIYVAGLFLSDYLGVCFEIMAWLEVIIDFFSSSSKFADSFPQPDFTA